MTRKTKIAWAETLYNAYNALVAGDVIYNNRNELICRALDCRYRCTATSPGGVRIKLQKEMKECWLSGNLKKRDNKWIIAESCRIHE